MATDNLPAKTEEKGVQTNTIRGLLEGDLFKEQLIRALPQHLSPERFIRIAVTTMNKTPMLAQCDQGSFFNALLTLSQLGLEPDGRRAHLIPFKNNSKGIVECQLIIDYKGIVELIHNTGDVSYIHADVVCEADQFEYDKGELRVHKIDFKKPRGPVYAAYTLFRFKDGTEKVEVMTKEEIELVRKRSKAANSGPWVTDWNEMAKKTTLRRGSKWVKLAPEQREVIEKDDDQFPDTDIRRDTGAELEKRLMSAREFPQVEHNGGKEAPPADAPLNASSEGLTGSRLAFWSKCGEMAGGEPIEMGKIASNLSGGKITDRESLITAADIVVQEAITKMTGGKKA